MIPFDVNEIRNWTIKDIPNGDFDFAFIFYKDETNNIRKFYVKEDGFNYSFDSNFVLGGFFWMVLPCKYPNKSYLYTLIL